MNILCGSINIFLRPDVIAIELQDEPEIFLVGVKR